jgi:hypothetical protein
MAEVAASMAAEPLADEKVAKETHLHGSSSSVASQQNIEALLSSDPRLERVVRWKRDLVVTPLLGLLYLVMFLDRTNIANAKIEGLVAGLDMPSDGYNNCLWIFYIPFVLAEVPSNLFLNLGRVKPSLYLGGQMFLLGELRLYRYILPHC